MGAVDKETIQSKVDEMLPTVDLNSFGLKSLIKTLETDLDLDEGTIKNDADLKEFVKNLVVKFNEGNQSQNEDDEASPIASTETPPSKKRKISKTKVSKTEQPSTKIGKRLKMLNKMARAMGKAPAIFSDLPEEEEERCDELSSRLKEKGAEFSGSIPTEAEIAKAQKIHDKAKDLEGIDTRNILETSGRRRRAPVSYKQEEKQLDSDDEDEDDEEESEDEEESNSEEDSSQENSEEENEF